jgi:hypothetical protein
MKKPNKPARSKFTVLHQVCKEIPGHTTARVAHKHGVDKQARSFNPWSQVVSNLYAHISQAMSLNDVCDGLAIQEEHLNEIRGATVPSRNGLANANRVRTADMAEELYWEVMDHVCKENKDFAHQHGGKNYAFRFKTPIHLVDATTIELVANCMDWAKHRRRKAAAKTHLRMDLRTFLPSFVIIDTAHQHEATRAVELCANLHKGEIVIFDKGYTDLEHFAQLDERGVWWVTRAKDNVAYEVVKECKVDGKKILRDAIIRWKHHKSKKAYGKKFRLVRAKVEVDGKEKEMEFITNRLDCAASSVTDLYRCRWQIELFFKSLKQNLQLGSFLGYSANAVRWQIWTGLLVHLLMRYLKWKSGWASYLGRLFTLVRCTLWLRWDVKNILVFYGTAGHRRRIRANVQQAYLPGFC